MSTWLHWSSILAWLGLSFFLSGMEAGVQALSRLRIRQWVRKGVPGAPALLGYLEQPEHFLWTILVGNTVANFAVICLLVADLHNQFGAQPVAFWTGFLGIIAFLYVFSELLPKTLFRRIPNRLCLRLVWLYRLFHVGLSPVVTLVEHFAGLLLRFTRGTAFTGRLFGNRDELRALMQESGTALTVTERALINRVLDAQNYTVGRVAAPLSDVSTVTQDLPLPGLLALARERQQERFPVWDRAGRGARIVGMVSLKRVLHAEPDPARRRVGDFLSPAVFLTEDTRLDVAVRRLQRGGSQLGIVMGRDGRERGMVTLDGLLQVLFGEGGL